LGGWLVDLHARGNGKSNPLLYPVKGKDKVTDIRFEPVANLVVPGQRKMRSATPCGPVETGSWPDAKAGRVWINDEQYFEPVAETAWAFPVGGYLPAQRWLKDLMGEIDASIKQHGGWPMN
jgi:hypothetical protein